MFRNSTTTRWTTALLLAAIAIPMLAPAAMADHGRRYKGVRESRVVHYGGRGHSRYVVRESNAGPLLAGLVGGFLIGQAVGGPHRVETRVVYRYNDPYSDGWYDSMDSYWASNRGCRHPRVLRVIDVRSGECVRTIRWNDGRWNDCERGWERDGGRYNDRGRYDDRGYDGRDDDRSDDRGGYDDRDDER